MKATYLEIAKNAKQIGLKIEDIIKLTGLSKEEIQEVNELFYDAKSSAKRLQEDEAKYLK